MLTLALFVFIRVNALRRPVTNSDLGIGAATDVGA